MKKMLIPILLVIFLHSSAFGQKKTATDAMNILSNDGQLLVVLPSSQKKIAVLEKVLSNKKLSKKEKERTSNMLAETNYEQHLIVKETIEAFEKFYSFSKVIFAYDFELKKVLKGDQNISILKSDGSFHTITIPTNYLYAHLGKTDYASSTNIDGWMIKFADGSLVPKPFPNPISTNPMKRAIRGLLDEPEAEHHKNAIELAQTIQSKFLNFSKN